MLGVCPRQQGGESEIEVIFASEELEDACRSNKEAERMWGQVGRVVIRRLATIAAAEAMVHLVNVPGRFHALTGDRKGQYAMEVSQRQRLILEPGNNPLPRAPDGGVDLGRVTLVRILGVIDYHGG